jgi:hypothetical protein
MRIEIIIFFIAAAIIANIYTDGKVLKMALSWKKYYKMAAVAFGALALYWLISRNPKNARNIVMTTNEYIKYLPLDRSTTSFVNPILDFTAKHSFENDTTKPFLDMPQLPTLPNYATPNQGGGGGGIGVGLEGGGGGITATTLASLPPSARRMLQSGKNSSKRSVSETKKKFVAANQGWKCGSCQKQLPAWFEVDHKIRLEYGGSNHIDNLVALCRHCHGEKTTIENL